MRISNRLKSLEKASGISSCCACNGFSHDVEYMDEGEPEPKPQTCSKCKKERRLVVVEYVTDWRALQLAQ